MTERTAAETERPGGGKALEVIDGDGRLIKRLCIVAAVMISALAIYIAPMPVDVKHWDEKWRIAGADRRYWLEERPDVWHPWREHRREDLYIYYDTFSSAKAELQERISPQPRTKSVWYKGDIQ